MGKLFSAKISQNFSDAFLATDKLNRLINERQQALEQEFNFRRRQLSLDEAFRRDNLGLKQQQEDRLQGQQNFDVSQSFAPVEGLGTGRVNPRLGTFENLTGDELTSLPVTTGQEIQDTFGASIGAGNFVRKDLVPSEPVSNLKKAGTGEFGNEEFATFFDADTDEIKRVKIGNVTTDIPPSDLTTPFIDTTESDDALANYKLFTGGNLVDASGEDKKGEKFNITTDEVTLEDLTRAEIETIKKQKLKKIESATNNEAKKYNEFYQDFDISFKKFIKAAGDGRITPKNLEKVVRESLLDAPPDMINAMLNLLRKRIF